MLLNIKVYVEVSQNLDLLSWEYLDLVKMQLVVCIDLMQYCIELQQQWYISFIKGWMGCKVVDFFMQFVGCEEKVDVK